MTQLFSFHLAGMIFSCLPLFGVSMQHISNGTTTINNVTMSKFDWDISKLNITVMPTVPVDVVVNFNISNRETLISLYEYDCRTPISPMDTINITKTYSPMSKSSGILGVSLRIGSQYKNSSIWTEESLSMGYLDFCVRVDLLLVGGHVAGNFPTVPTIPKDAISVNFLETKVSLKATVGGRLEIIDDFGDVEISACQCNRGGSCINDTVTSLDSNIFLCLESNYHNTLFLGVETLEFVRTEDRVAAYTPIANARPNTATAVTKGGHRGLVVTRLGNKLMNTVADLSVEGVAILAFDDSRGRRNLRRTRMYRSLQNDGANGSFQLDMSIDTSTTWGLPLWMIILFIAMGCMTIIVVARRLDEELKMSSLR